MKNKWGFLSFSLGERVYEAQYLDWNEHIRRSNVSLVNDWEFARNAPSLVGPGVPSTRPLDLEPLLPRLESNSNKIFLVHGHSEGPRQAVAEFLRSRGLEAIILHEQPNEGKTIIEKFEKHSDVGFAVVLLTPDDFGGSNADPDKVRPRARQNVVLELGYFMGKLGRNRVCCLYVEGVELPSDYQGVLWLPYDDSGAWRELLTKEIIAAGIEVELSVSVGPVALTKRKLLA